MNLVKFEYIAPTTVEKAVDILHREGQEASLMAGGTDLLVKIRRNVVSPKLIVGLKKIRTLEQVKVDKGQGLTIGATVTLSTIAENKKIIKNYPTIALAARSTANPQIRNVGTIIGNICNASPSADNAPILLAMGTILNIRGPYGDKNIRLEDFFLGPSITALAFDEIVTSAFVPEPFDNYGTAYSHLSQRGNMDCSAVGVGTMLTFKGGKIKKINIFVGACAPIPTRAIMAEKILQETKPSDRLIHEAALQVAKEMAPISDIRASAEYRKKMVYVMAKRAIKHATDMAKRK